jgi:hypothetical protein
MSYFTHIKSTKCSTLDTNKKTKQVQVYTNSTHALTQCTQ